MKKQIIYITVGILLSILFSCNKHQENTFKSNLPTDAQRVWIGPEYWANPMQDWQLKNGKINCMTSGGFRNVYLLTHEIGSQEGDFSMSIHTENLKKGSDSLSLGWIGFEIGIKGEFHDYCDNAIRGRGFPIGITTNGQLFIGKIDSNQIVVSDLSFDELELSIHAKQVDQSNYTIFLEVKSSSSSFKIERNNIDANWIEGGLSIMCHSGPLKEFKDQVKFDEYPDWGTAPGTSRNGNITFAFSDWELSGDKITSHPEQVFGPILFTQYTLGAGILKLSAQLPPIGKKDAQTIALQVKSNSDWETIQVQKINTISRSALFRIEDWDNSKDTPYRLVYQFYSKENQLQDYYYEGLIRKEPLDKEEIVIAAFTGNNDLGFPNIDIFESIKYLNPDLLFFSGDQIYEGIGGYGVQKLPLEMAYIDYLRKWYLFGWAYGDLLRNRPSIAITDDHDVYHGNIWGAGGKATPKGSWGAQAQDAGGYKMPASWVNMVQRTQTAHLPDAIDPKSVEQGIGVYFTDLKYAGISFAILEDRKFKSAPKVLLPEAKIYNGWAQNIDFNAAKDSDIKGASLLGIRQLDFLENWSAEWSGDIWMKVVLSQTIFANVATLPYEACHSDAIVPKLRILQKGDYPPNDVVVSDFDSNGWPQTGRNNAIKAIRKSFAFHIAGDQHLGSFIQYGVDDWQDAGYAFCVPSISNVWPRRWYPAEGGVNHKKDMPKYTGDFRDGFGNLISVQAISNPVFTGKKPAKLYDRATGFGIIRFHKSTRDITVECWPRQANPETDKQYEGWPITIRQQDNYLANSEYHLPFIEIEGMNNPVFQLIDENTNEIIYTLRIDGNNFQAKTPLKSTYTIKIGELGSKDEKTIHHLSSNKAVMDTLRVVF